MMFASGFEAIHSLYQENPTHFADNSEMMPIQYLDNFLVNFPNLQNSLPVHDLSSQSCISNNSTSDEGDGLQLGIINERKQRRMISNRESARRLRMRKQKQLDELLLHVVRFRTENHELVDKLNNVSESHDRVVQENARLKEEASDLRQMLTDAQHASTYNGFRDLEEVPCTAAHLRAESSKYFITSSTNLLQ